MGKIILSPSNSVTTIQKALDTRNSEIIFTRGTYGINKTLYTGEDVKLTFLSGAKLQQCGKINHILMSRAYKNTTGYNGARNIVIEGLTIEGMGKYSTKLNLVTLWHSQNVTLRDCTFLDAYHFHALEINGCKNVLVDDCNFLGYNADLKNDFREQIQIDFSSESAIFLFEHGSKCYDNTCCENITIQNCTFDKSTSRKGASSCIGNHAQPSDGKHHKNIIIDSCCFTGYGTNPKDSCIKLVAMDNVTIKNNKADGFGRFVFASPKTYSYTKNGTKCKVGVNDGTCNNLNYENNNKVTNPTGGFVAYEKYLV